MSMDDTKPSLAQLAEGAAQEVQAQQAQSAAHAARPAPPHRARQWLAGALAVACIGMLAVQAPKISAPYEWPDPDRNPIVADADLEAVVGLIDIYRIQTGSYPSALGDIRLPQGLAEVIGKSKLDYRPGETGYVLDWTLPHWQATYASETGKASVQPRAKP